MIGIFDSGSGGLTVLSALRRVLPRADVIYFGDIKNAPYGIKTPEELSQLTVSAVHFLQERGASSIVSACNSVSASLTLSLHDPRIRVTSKNFIEMVEPTVARFKDSAARLLLVATPATIHSGIYQDGFRTIGKKVTALAIPELAGAIEFGQAEEVMREMIRDALSGTDLSAYDYLLLCCTHYPLVAHVFRKEVPASLAIFDPADAVAERVVEQFASEKSGDGTTSFFITKESAVFRKHVEKLFPNMSTTVTVV